MAPGKLNPELSSVSWTLTNESNRDSSLMKSTVRGASSTDKEVGKGGFLRCGRPHFMVQKTWIFQVGPVRTNKGGEVCLSARTKGERGLQQCENSGQESQFFAML